MCVCECVCFDAEVRDGTLPAVLVCPERSQPIIPLNYLLTRWNWCFWSGDWIIRNVGHSYSPWLVSLICPIWSPCLSNLLGCATYNNSCSRRRHGRCFLSDLLRWAWEYMPTAHGLSGAHHKAFFLSTDHCFVTFFHSAAFINLHLYLQMGPCFLRGIHSQKSAPFGNKGT